MKSILTILLIFVLASCTVVSPYQGVGVSVQPVLTVPQPTLVVRPRNYWWPRPYYNNFYTPTVRVNINYPRRHYNHGPRGGRRN